MKKLTIVILCVIFIWIISCDITYSSISVLKKHNYQMQPQDDNGFIHFDDKEYRRYKAWRDSTENDPNNIYAGELSEKELRDAYYYQYVIRREGREFERNMTIITFLAMIIIIPIIIIKKVRNIKK